jgi:hypothetical protein
MFDIQDLNKYTGNEVNILLIVPCSIEFIFGSLRDCCSDLGRLWLGAYSTEQIYSLPMLNQNKE